MPEALNDKRIAEFRKKICEVAIRQSKVNGWEKVSMRSIARELGYSATALYSYFKNKDHIFAAARIAAYERLNARLTETVKNCGESTDQLKSIGQAYIDFSRTEPAAFELVTLTRQAAPTEYPDIIECIQTTLKIFENCLIRFSDSQPICGSTTVAAQILWSLLSGSISMQISGNIDVKGKALDDFVASSIDVFKAGIVGTENSGKKPKSIEQFSLDL